MFATESFLKSLKDREGKNEYFFWTCKETISRHELLNMCLVFYGSRLRKVASAAAGAATGAQDAADLGVVATSTPVPESSKAQTAPPARLQDSERGEFGWHR